ncbi:MAG TPA: hypothetical protein VLG49_04995 [Rhabdochlamydiaceae bacterium]|nr:hypothetical protein [Rhabdochlamydiaceae bacterium]
MSAVTELPSNPKNAPSPYKFTLSVKTECPCYVHLQLHSDKLHKIGSIYSKVHPMSFELKVTVPREAAIIYAIINKQKADLFAPYLSNPKFAFSKDGHLAITTDAFKIHETEELAFSYIKV